MNRAIISAGLIMLICFTSMFCFPGSSWAGNGRKLDSSASADVISSLEAVQWVGPGVTYDALKGKTTVILVYATWCPKCNEWSGKFFEQLRDAIKGRPVVVLAVNADETPRSARRYVAQRNFAAPNIIHGYHPALHTRLGFDSNLFRYVQISPGGEVTRRGQAGMQDQGGNFGLPERIVKAKNLGEFLFITPQMPEPLQSRLWPCELGRMSDSELRAVQKKLPAAVALSKMFKSSPQSKKAKQVVVFMEKDKQFKQELAAGKAYQAALERIAAKPQRRNSLLNAISRRFQGTHFGEMAKEAVETVGKE